MVQAAGTRDQIQQELCAIAQAHIDNWESYASRETRNTDHGFEFVSRQTDDNGLTYTVAKASVPGLTLEQHADFRQNIGTKIASMDSNLTMIECPEVEGRRCFLQ